MNYEKKYKEALERAKSFSEKFGGNDYAAYIFPELCESEDERIRKALIDGVRQIRCKNDITQEQMIAWLEKQKENLKSADSIPSDCTSGAKCEDRWHKVGDSLPDDPREVLCKDEAGNYFIGRYYVGEGWEISNYDDEDKPHHLNPPVSKWIDFPSEKQKEQKPVISGNDFGWIDELKHDLEHPEALDKKVEEALKQKPVYESDTRTVEDLQLLGFVYDLLAELDWSKDWAMSRDECLKRFNSYRPQPKQEWSEEDELNIGWLIAYLKGESAGEYYDEMMRESLVDWLKSLPERFNLQPKEEWSEEEFDKVAEEYVWTSIDSNDPILVPKYIPLLLSLFKGGYAYAKSPRRQPKREWTEDEKQKLNRIYSIIGWAMDEHAFSSCKKLIGDKEGVELQDFLRSIAKPETQPHWKPSEEQMEQLHYALTPGSAFDCDILNGLYEQLKKLM